MVTFKNREKSQRIQAESDDRKIRFTANTPYESCRERLTAFGGLLALVKMLDLICFTEYFEKHYVHPKRRPKYVAAKIQYHGGRDVVKYSMHDARAGGLIDFLHYLARGERFCR